MSDGFNIVEVENPELVSGDKGTSTGATLTSNPVDANTEALHVDGSKVTQPVSATSLPLPTGAATEATIATLATEAKLEAVRALLATIDADTSVLAAVDYATETTQATLATEAKLEAVRALLATIDADTSNLDVLLSTRASEAKLEDVRAKLAEIDTVLDSIKDVDGIKKITDQLPAGTNEIGAVAQGTKAALADAWPSAIVDALGNAITSTDDAGIRRLEIQGKVQSIGAIPPPSTTPVTISADTPLSVGTHDTTFVIPNGETFHLQQITAGNEDPTKGASTTVIYYNGTEHVVERVYTAGFTIQAGFADLTAARDGTSLVGNAGGTNTIIVRRAKFSGTDIEIDAEVSGYTT